MVICREIDGEPKSTTVWDGESLTYRTVGVLGHREVDVEKWMDVVLERVRKWCVQNHATLIWRRRPRLEKAGRNWRKTARFITSKPMPEEIWSEFEHVEGLELRRV